MNCDVGEAMEGLENELNPTFLSLHLHHNSFPNLSVTLPTSQPILQAFCSFTYITAHSPTLLSLLLHHRLFTYVTWHAAHGLLTSLRSPVSFTNVMDQLYSLLVKTVHGAPTEVFTSKMFYTSEIESCN